MTSAAPLLRARPLASLLPSDHLFWGALAAVAAIIPSWGVAVSVTVTGFPQVASVVAALLLLRAAYVVRRPRARVVHALLENGAAIVAYTALLATVSYFCGRSPHPLFDHALGAADRWLGYQWQAWADYENGIPLLSLVLRLAYASLLPQTVLALVVLPIIGDGTRGFDLLRASLIAAVIACAGSYFWPAMGPDPVGEDWFVPWTALHETAPFTTSLPRMQGIITFPSFHATLGILLLHAFRSLGAVTWMLGLVELSMLVSTTTVGRHYAVDVAGGIATALVAIALTNQLKLRFPLRPAGARSPAASLATA